METMQIFGNCGHLLVELEHGLIVDRLDYEPDGVPGTAESYDFIAKFDVAEFARTYTDETIAGTHVDILDIGYWTVDGQYEPAEPSVRADIAQFQREYPAVYSSICAGRA